MKFSRNRNIILSNSLRINKSKHILFSPIASDVRTYVWRCFKHFSQFGLVCQGQSLSLNPPPLFPEWLFRPG